ncbi:MAG: STAS domain-containing protein, partial [Intestinibacter sp.]
MIKCYLDDKTLLVQFTTTELDHHVSTYIRENVDEIIMRKNVKKIIVDYQNIRFMDSSGIGVII